MTSAPASRASNTPATVSHGLLASMTLAPMRPSATHARSTAADPNIRTRCTTSASRPVTRSRSALSMLRRRKLASGGRGPVFPDSRGGWRDPSNTSRDLRNARGSAEFAWVTSHVFRKTAATEMDRDGLTARQIADQLGHAKVSMTQDRYLGRRAVGKHAARSLDRAHREAKGKGEEGVSAG